MQLLRFIPIQLTIFITLGIFLGDYLNTEPLIPALGSIVLLVVLGFMFFKKLGSNGTGFAIATAMLTINIGMLAISVTNQKNTPGHYSENVTNDSQLFHLKIRETLKPTSYSRRYIAEVKSIGQQTTTGRILLNVSRANPGKSLEIDTEILLQGEIRSIDDPLNPHQFNYRSYLQHLNVLHQIRADVSHYFLIPTASKTIYGRAAALRHTIISKLKRYDFGEAELSVIQALLLGQRDDISEETYTNYKNAGAVHILAVSGLHIGILLLLLQIVLKPFEMLPKGKTIKLVVIVTLLWGFALLAGFSASIVRAVTMFSFVAYALYLNRPSNTFNILALSMMFILLVINPNLLFQVGFQMSYAAVFAIVWIYPLLQKFWYPKNPFVRKVWQLLSVSVAAQLGVLPIALFYFHQFPGLFFISNLLIVPALGVILGMGILVVLLSVFNWLPEAVVTAYDTLIRWMNELIAWVAQQEAFVFQNISFDLVQLVLAYGILIFGLHFITAPNFKKAMTLGLVIFGFQGYLFYSTYQTRKQERLWLLHQTANTVFLQQSGPSAILWSSEPSKTSRLAADYQVAERITSVQFKPIASNFRYKNETLLIIDSTGVYPPNTATDYLILTASPKINLDRLIDSLQPKRIIADGSNYRSYVARWQQSCSKRKLPFHYSGEKGAYLFP